MLKRHESTTEQMIIAYHNLLDFLVKHEVYYPRLSVSDREDFKARIEQTINEYDSDDPQVAVLKAIQLML